MPDPLHGDVNEPEPQRKLGNLDPAKISTNERRHYPYVIGTAVLPGLHIGAVYDQYTEDIPYLDADRMAVELEYDSESTPTPGID